MVPKKSKDFFLDKLRIRDPLPANVQTRNAVDALLINLWKKAEFSSPSKAHRHLDLCFKCKASRRVASQIFLRHSDLIQTSSSDRSLSTQIESICSNSTLFMIKSSFSFEASSLLQLFNFSLICLNLFIRITSGRLPTHLKDPTAISTIFSKPSFSIHELKNLKGLAPKFLLSITRSNGQ
ncbi:hypothetical protein Hdeb2414_s0001g00036011 [Helianthus debilis subsp. tardiflorus]